MLNVIWFTVSTFIFIIWCYWIFRPIFGYNELLSELYLKDENEIGQSLFIIILLIVGAVISLFWWLIIAALIVCIPLIGLGWILKKLFYDGTK